MERDTSLTETQSLHVAATAEEVSSRKQQDDLQQQIKQLPLNIHGERKSSVPRCSRGLGAGEVLLQLEDAEKEKVLGKTSRIRNSESWRRRRRSWSKREAVREEPTTTTH